MTLKNTLFLLCASILVGCVVGRTKYESAKLPTDQGNDEIETTGTKRTARQYSPWRYGNQNVYGSQETYQDVNGPNAQDQGHGQRNRNTGYISGHVRPGETVSIGNGRGHINVVGIDSTGETDYYVGFTDGRANPNSGFEQLYNAQQGQSGILVNKRPGSQDNVFLWNGNGNDQSSIRVDRTGVEVNSGNTYENTYQPYNRQNNKRINQHGNPAGRNAYQSSSSIYSQQDQVYLNSQRYY